MFGLKAMLGEVAHVIATGQRVLPRRTQSFGYQFKFPTLDAALADVLR
jgi:NAD dependent epimerase/dehydratase family enzyme